MSRASRRANRESSRRANNASYKADKGKSYYQPLVKSNKKDELLQKYREQKGL